MNPYDQLIQKISHIEQALHYSFTTKNYLISAFTHSSFLNEYKNLALKHNERLEFLGDSVLNLIVTEYLFRNFPEIAEGELSSFRSSIVSAPSCTKFLEKIAVGQYLLVGKGEQLNTGRRQTSIHADLFEAILGAIYLDGGLEKARTFFFDNYTGLLQSLLTKPQLNFKALLQEHLQRIKHAVPQYRVIDESGPDHEKKFTIGVYIEDLLIGTGNGTSKKEAEQNAASIALKNIEETPS
ncbi:MAG: ribonuclease 3 [Chlamydiia bacterium]|nr:ribonuclease 3 [Chlamydiia bacterium]